MSKQTSLVRDYGWAGEQLSHLGFGGSVPYRTRFLSAFDSGCEGLRPYDDSLSIDFATDSGGRWLSYSLGIS